MFSKYCVQGRHCRFLAGKDAIVAATSPARHHCRCCFVFLKIQRRTKSWLPYLPWRPYIGLDESQLYQYVPPDLDVSWGNSSHLRLRQKYSCIFGLRGVAKGGSGGPEPPPPLRYLADQLTLFKPRGQIMPNTLLSVPPDSKSYLNLCT